MGAKQKIVPHPASPTTAKVLLAMLLEEGKDIETMVVSVHRKSDGMTEQYSTEMKNGDLAWHKHCINQYLNGKIDE